MLVPVAPLYETHVAHIRQFLNGLTALFQAGPADKRLDLVVTAEAVVIDSNVTRAAARV